jgi:hypothetical protein
MINGVKMWISIFQQFHKETAGFKMDLYSLSDRELVSIKPVNCELINHTGIVLKAINNKHHREIKKGIQYLTVLRTLQADAIIRQIKAAEDQNASLQAKINKL